MDFFFKQLPEFSKYWQKVVEIDKTEKVVSASIDSLATLVIQSLFCSFSKI